MNDPANFPIKNRNKKIELLLKRFLKGHKTYSKYVNNLNEPVGVFVNMILNQPIYWHPIWLIANSFVWELTIEGQEYWDDLNNGWVQYYEKHQFDYEYE